MLRPYPLILDVLPGVLGALIGGKIGDTYGAAIGGLTAMVMVDRFILEPIRNPRDTRVDNAVNRIINELPPEIRSSVKQHNHDWRVQTVVLLVNNQYLHWKLGASIVYDTGVVYTDNHGNPHRGDDLPAVVDDSFRRWFRHGKLHRDNHMPATIHADGSVRFWRNGEQYHPFDAEMDEEPECT